MIMTCPLERGPLSPAQTEGGLKQMLVAPLARSALVAAIKGFARFPLGAVVRAPWRPCSCASSWFGGLENKRPRGDPRPGIRPVPRAFRSARGSLLRSSQGARADLGEVKVPEEPEPARRGTHDVPTSLPSARAPVKRRQALPGR